MARTAHTPTPWRVSLDAYVVHVETDRTLAACPATLTIGADEARANADLIVRAVNAHESLVSALERIEAMLSDGMALGRNQKRALADSARAALALAKGCHVARLSEEG